MWNTKDVYSAWNIIDCGLTEVGSGHHYWEMKALSDELARRGTEVRIFCHKATSAGRFPGVPVFPTFSLFAYASISQDLTWGPTENLVVHNRSFDHDLSQVDPSLFRNSLAFFPMLSERQLLGMFRWLGRLQDQVRPKTVAMLSGLHDVSATRFDPRLYQAMWRDCPDSLKSGIALCVRTPNEATAVQQLLGTKAHVLPSPLAPPSQSRARIGEAVSPQMIVSFVGNARYEKGCDLLPDIVRECSLLDVRFVFQVKPDTFEGFDMSALLALRSRPNVEIHEVPLSREDYHALIANSVVLLPYRSGAYRLRHSGIYTEAKCLGAPVIVPGGTWMADDVKSRGNGLVFEEHNANAIARSIARAQGDLGALRERAAACAEHFRKGQGPDRCVDAIAALFAHEG